MNKNIEMVQIADKIYFMDGRIHHEFELDPAEKNKALVDSLEEIIKRSPVSLSKAIFMVQCILSGEYIPLICGTGLGCWNGTGYYSDKRYDKWYVWQNDGILGSGFYEGTCEVYQSSDGYLRERSTIASKFLEK